MPGSADGILTKPHEAQLARFNAKKGERLVVEVLARRAGSPVDPVIEILDSGGKPVPRALLRATAKTYTTFRDHDSAGPGIRLDTWNEVGIDDYLYVNGELAADPRAAEGARRRLPVLSGRGQRVGFLGTTPAHHSQGSPMYKVEIHPPGKTFPPNGLPVFTLHYRNDDGGPGFGKDSFLLFDAPADGTYQVRVTDARGANGPTHAYRVTVRPPKPDFTVSFYADMRRSVWKGGGDPGHGDHHPARRLRWPSPRATRRITSRIPRPRSRSSRPGTPLRRSHCSPIPTRRSPRTAKLKLVARATIDGKEVVREAVAGLPKLVEPGDIVTRISAIGDRYQTGPGDAASSWTSCDKASSPAACPSRCAGCRTAFAC